MPIRKAPAGALLPLHGHDRPATSSSAVLSTPSPERSSSITLEIGSGSPEHSTGIQPHPQRPFRSSSASSATIIAPMPVAVAPPLPAHAAVAASVAETSQAAVRCTFGALPRRRSMLHACPVPLGLVLEPFAPLSTKPPQIVGQPEPCVSCGALPTPLSEEQMKVMMATGGMGRWRCGFCDKVNNLQLRGGISGGGAHLPPEFLHSCVEFSSTSTESSAEPPLRILVVDGHLSAAALRDLVASLKAALRTLAPDTRLALLVVTDVVAIYELGLRGVASAQCFDAHRLPSAADRRRLEEHERHPPFVAADDDGAAGAVGTGSGSFVVPLHVCRETVLAILSSLCPDPCYEYAGPTVADGGSSWPPSRGLGAGLAWATCLAAAVAPATRSSSTSSLATSQAGATEEEEEEEAGAEALRAHILLATGGACTSGPGRDADAGGGGTASRDAGGDDDDFFASSNEVKQDDAHGGGEEEGEDRGDNSGARRKKRTSFWHRLADHASAHLISADVFALGHGDTLKDGGRFGVSSLRSGLGYFIHALGGAVHLCPGVGTERENPAKEAASSSRQALTLNLRMCLERALAGFGSVSVRYSGRRQGYALRLSRIIGPVADGAEMAARGRRLRVAGSSDDSGERGRVTMLRCGRCDGDTGLVAILEQDEDEGRERQSMATDTAAAIFQVVARFRRPVQRGGARAWERVTRVCTLRLPYAQEEEGRMRYALDTTAVAVVATKLAVLQAASLETPRATRPRGGSVPEDGSGGDDEADALASSSSLPSQAAEMGASFLSSLLSPIAAFVPASLGLGLEPSDEAEKGRPRSGSSSASAAEMVVEETSEALVEFCRDFFAWTGPPRRTATTGLPMPVPVPTQLVASDVEPSVSAAVFHLLRGPLLGSPSLTLTPDARGTRRRHFLRLRAAALRRAACPELRMISAYHNASQDVSVDVTRVPMTLLAVHLQVPRSRRRRAGGSSSTEDTVEAEAKGMEGKTSQDAERGDGKGIRNAALVMDGEDEVVVWLHRDLDLDEHRPLREAVLCRVRQLLVDDAGVDVGAARPGGHALPLAAGHVSASEMTTANEEAAGATWAYAWQHSAGSRNQKHEAGRLGLLTPGQRWPVPAVRVVKQHSAEAHALTSRLAPQHHDSLPEQLYDFPMLRNMSPESLERMQGVMRVQERVRLRRSSAMVAPTQELSLRQFAAQRLDVRCVVRPGQEELPLPGWPEHVLAASTAASGGVEIRIWK